MALSNDPTRMDDRLVADLSSACIRDMGLTLSGHVGKNYKDLASKFDFSALDVAGFESKGHGNPGSILLQRWSMRANTTVTALRHHLKDLERHDVISILDAELKDPVDLIVCIQNNFKVVFNEMIKTFGNKTIEETLESCAQFKEFGIPLFKLRCISEHCCGNVMKRKAADYKGQQLSFTYSDVPCQASDDPTDGYYVLPSQLMRPSPVGGNTPMRQSVIDRNLQHREKEFSSCVDLQCKNLTSHQSNFQQTAGKSTHFTSTSTVSQPVFIQRGHTCISPSTVNSSDSIFLSRQKGTNVTLPVAAVVPMTSVNEQLSALSAETIPKETSRNLADAPYEPYNSSDYENSDSLRSETSCKRRDFLNYSSQGGEPRGTSDTSPVNDSDHIASDYMTTNWVGYDADEGIRGYHSDATSNKVISQLIKPYQKENGAYIIRPSRRDPSDRSISVVHNCEVINFTIHKLVVKLKDKAQYLYFLDDQGPSFDSISELVSFYKKNSIDGHIPGFVLVRAIEN